MAVITGTLADSPYYPYDGGYTTDAVDGGYPVNALSADGNLVTDGIYGTLVDSQPVATIGAVVSGTLGMGMGDIFYNQIIIEPSELALGNLLSNQQRSVEVFNSFLVTKDLTSFVTNNGDGIAVTEPVTPTYTFQPLESQTYDFTFSTVGPATIDADYQWTFDGVTYTLDVTGSRVVVLPFKPNWNTNISETLSWLTVVHKAYDGTEQRELLRQKPRRNLEYLMTLKQDEARLAQTYLYGWQHRTFAIPIWNDVISLGSDHSAGVSTVQVDVSDLGFTVGSNAILYSDYRTYEVVEITAINASSFDTNLPLINNWSSGSRVLPLEFGRLQPSVTMKRPSDDIMHLSSSIDLDPLTTNPVVDDTVAAPATYNGYELLLDKHNWSKDIDMSSIIDINMIDFKTGSVVGDALSEFTGITRRFAWLLNGRTAITAFRNMLARRHGRRDPVYIPTWNSDMIITSDITAAATGIEIEEIGYSLFINQHPARTHIRITTANGSFNRQITGSSINGDKEQLSIDSALGVDVAASEITRVSYLGLYRLVSDNVKINWKSNTVAEVELTFQLVQA